MVTGVFVHVPRTAGTSIQKALGIRQQQRRASAKMDGVVTFGHKMLRLDGVFTFAFCRNPYDRAVSMWSFNNMYNKGVNLTFREFCYSLKNWSWGQHLRLPQVARAHDLDFLGRFENLQDDFDDLCDILEIERRELPHLNASERGPWQDYYDLQTQRIIRDYYAEDFERLGY